MPHDPSLGIPHLTKFDFEQALERHHAEGAPKLAAFNPAEFAKKAAALARIAPTVLTILAAAGVPLPAGTAAVVDLVVRLADTVLASDVAHA